MGLCACDPADSRLPGDEWDAGSTDPCDGLQDGDTVTRLRFLRATVSHYETCVSEEQVATCEGGSLSTFSGTYLFESCEQLPARACGDVEDGGYAERVRYRTSTVAWDRLCESEKQLAYCRDGELREWSGSFAESKCEPARPRDCGPVAHGETEQRLQFESASVPHGSECRSEVQERGCRDGTLSAWSGSFEYSDCVQDGPRACGDVAHGELATRTRYRTSIVAWNEMCEYEEQTAVCDDGTLGSWSGSFRAASCDARAPRSCGDVSHGDEAARVRYLSSVVDTGRSCDGERQTALCTDGELSAWSGSLTVPSCRVERFPNFALGTNVACELDPQSGYGRCWGNDSYGAASGIPRSVRFARLARGAHCGIRLEDGGFECWGREHGLYSSRPNGTAYRDVDSDYEQICAIRRDNGHVECFASGRTMKTIDFAVTAIEVESPRVYGLRESDGALFAWDGAEFKWFPGGHSFTQLAADDFRNLCGVRGDSQELVCWISGEFRPQVEARVSAFDLGFNAACWLDADTHEIGCLQDIELPGKFVDVDSGYGNVCGIRADGARVCGGTDRHGTLSGGHEIRAEAGLAADVDSFCARGVDGHLHCAGPLAERVTIPDTGFVDFDVANANVCAIEEQSRRGVCWGRTLSSPSATVPLESIAVGGVHACALEAATGRAVCWGANSGRYGDVPLDLSLRELAVGAANGCATRRDIGEVICWGRDDAGVVTGAPLGVPLHGAAVGDEHACALREDGTAVCWGSNEVGQLDAPETLPFSKLSADLNHTCGLRRDNGEPVCWGNDEFGVVSRAPRKRMVHLDVGRRLACGTLESGVATCWGYHVFNP